MGVFGESHKRACTPSQKAGRGRSLLIFQRRKKGPRGVFCPKTGEVGLIPALGGSPQSVLLCNPGKLL